MHGHQIKYCLRPCCHLLDTRGRTVLHHAIEHRWPLADCEYLISKGIDVDARDDVGKTALILSTPLSIDICKFLIAHGADVNIKYDYATTALHRVTDQSIDKCILLLEAGADVNAFSGTYSTPIYASNSDAYQALFADYGADLGFVAFGRDHWWSGRNMAYTSRNMLWQCILRHGLKLPANIQAELWRQGGRPNIGTVGTYVPYESQDLPHDGRYYDLAVWPVDPHMRALFFASGTPINNIKKTNLPIYYSVTRDAAFYRRMAAVRWWYAVAAASAK
jgi:hypothetical protein